MTMDAGTLKKQQTVYIASLAGVVSAVVSGYGDRTVTCKVNKLPNPTYEVFSRDFVTAAFFATREEADAYHTTLVARHNARAEG
jgi:hypothetical protein